MNSPLVSIIIPIYNREALVEETLDSICSQTYSNWECIVVDDHSTDNTVTVVTEYSKLDSRITIHKRPDNRKKGANACRNYGFELSNGEFINWFDSDDLMLPEKLEYQVKALIENADMPFTVCQTLVFEGNRGNVLGLRKELIYSEDFFNDYITNTIKWLTQAPLFRNSFINLFSLRFNEELHKAQERDFFVRVLSNITDYHYDKIPLVLFRKHKTSITYSKSTIEKIASTFKVNKTILQNNESKLTHDSKKYLIKKMISEIKKSLYLKEYRLTQKLQKEFSELNQTNYFEVLKLKIGVFCLKYFGIGDSLLK